MTNRIASLSLVLFFFVLFSFLLNYKIKHTEQLSNFMFSVPLKLSLSLCNTRTLQYTNQLHYTSTPKCRTRNTEHLNGNLFNLAKLNVKHSSLHFTSLFPSDFISSFLFRSNHLFFCLHFRNFFWCLCLLVIIFSVTQMRKHNNLLLPIYSPIYACFPAWTAISLKH